MENAIVIDLAIWSKWEDLIGTHANQVLFNRRRMATNAQVFCQAEDYESQSYLLSSNLRSVNSQNANRRAARESMHVPYIKSVHFDSVLSINLKKDGSLVCPRANVHLAGWQVREIGSSL